MADESNYSFFEEAFFVNRSRDAPYELLYGDHEHYANLEGRFDYEREPGCRLNEGDFASTQRSSNLGPFSQQLSNTTASLGEEMEGSDITHGPFDPHAGTNSQQSLEEMVPDHEAGLSSPPLANPILTNGKNMATVPGRQALDANHSTSIQKNIDESTGADDLDYQLDDGLGAAGPGDQTMTNSSSAGSDAEEDSMMVCQDDDEFGIRDHVASPLDNNTTDNKQGSALSNNNPPTNAGADSHNDNVSSDIPDADQDDEEEEPEEPVVPILPSGRCSVVRTYAGFRLRCPCTV
ncbi:hypothetical protein QBC45DRAFT_437817 [Copromyces sp. CBS 386.78]|nr:hypothetical protein QBC45DRAFT_437817 [Copromyces sp. CBS 386.78]